MNIEAVRAFLEVVACGSIQQAADNLHLSQSAMSSRIKGLESRLNRQLFIRKRHGLELSSGGHAFQPHAEALINAWERARQETALGEGSDAVINLGVQLNHWDALVEPWLCWMEEKAPRVETQVRADYSTRLMTGLRDGLLDLAVVYEPQHNPAVIIDLWFEEPLLLVSTTDREAGQGRVPGYVYMDWGEDFRIQHNRAFPNAPFHRLEVGLAATALQHIRRHGGSGYFPASLVRQEIASGQLFAVREAPTLSLSVYLAWKRHGQNQTALELALRGLKEISTS